MMDLSNFSHVKLSDLATLLDGLPSHLATALQPQPLPLCALLDRWDLDRKADGFSASGRRRYRDQLDEFLQTTLGGEATLDMLTPDAIKRHKRAMVSRGCKAGTIRNALGAIRSFVRWCVAEQLLMCDITAGIPWPKVADPDVIFLRDSDLDELFTALTIPLDLEGDARVQWERNRRCIYLIAYTGIRRAEAASQRWDDIDLDAGLLFVRHGKGGRNRMLPVHDALGAELRRVPEAERVGPVLARRGPQDMTPQPLTAKSVSHIFERWLPRLLPNRNHLIQPHQLRRAFATRLRRAGVDLEAIRRYLGHKSLETTQRYLDGGPDEDTEAEHIQMLPKPGTWVESNKKKG